MFPQCKAGRCFGRGPRWSQQPATRGACQEGHSLLHSFFLCPHKTLGACFVQNLLSQLIYLLQFRKFSS